MQENCHLRCTKLRTQKFVLNIMVPYYLPPLNRTKPAGPELVRSLGFFMATVLALDGITVLRYYGFFGFAVFQKWNVAEFTSCWARRGGRGAKYDSCRHLPHPPSSHHEGTQARSLGHLAERTARSGGAIPPGG